MRTWQMTGFVVLAVAFAWAPDRTAGKPGKPGEPPAAKAQVGQEAPDFTLLDSAGQKQALSAHKDKVVVLQWVNQECPWSRKVIPVIAGLQKKYADRGVAWFGIESTHWRKPEENEKYIKDEKLAFPILMDNDGEVGRTYGAKTTPHVFVINKGKLVYAGALHNNQDGQKKESEVRNYLDETLAAVLAGKDVPVAETTAWGCSVKYKSVAKP